MRKPPILSVKSSAALNLLFQAPQVNVNIVDEETNQPALSRFLQDALEAEDPSERLEALECFNLLVNHVEIDFTICKVGAEKMSPISYVLYHVLNGKSRQQKEFALFCLHRLIECDGSGTVSDKFPQHFLNGLILKTLDTKDEVGQAIATACVDRLMSLPHIGTRFLQLVLDVAAAEKEPKRLALALHQLEHIIQNLAKQNSLPVVLNVITTKKIQFVED